MALTPAPWRAANSYKFSNTQLNLRLASIRPEGDDNNRYVAHLYNERCELRIAVSICRACVTLHVYRGCDGRIMITEFEDCEMDTIRPVLHPEHVINLERRKKRIQLVRDSIMRTNWDGFLPPVSFHGRSQTNLHLFPTRIYHRYVPMCFHGSSPEFIVQERRNLGTDIYFRRCDGVFRNLAYEAVQIGDSIPGVEQQEEIDNRIDEEIDEWLDGENKSTACNLDNYLL